MSITLAAVTMKDVFPFLLFGGFILVVILGIVLGNRADRKRREAIGALLGSQGWAPTHAPTDADKLEAPAKDKGLGDLASWPVSIGYFEPKGGDLTPSYQIDFRLYANGVSRELLIDYGDFSIHGTLTSLEYLKPTECHPAP